MVVLGFDTATPATVVGLRTAGGELLERRDDPPPGSRPRHASRLLAFCWELLEEARLGWADIEAIAVGAGPGTFTGLRIGLATARGLAQALRVELTGVPSLRALAQQAFDEPSVHAQAGAVLTVLDARRGEAFVAAYRPAPAGEPPRELLAPVAVKPDELGRVAHEIAARELPQPSGGSPWPAGELSNSSGEAPTHAGAPLLAVGDGAALFAQALEAAGVSVPEEGSSLLRLGAGAICTLSLLLPAAADVQEVVPLYCRAPDAEIALKVAGR